MPQKKNKPLLKTVTGLDLPLLLVDKAQLSCSADSNDLFQYGDCYRFTRQTYREEAYLDAYLIYLDENLDSGVRQKLFAKGLTGTSEMIKAWFKLSFDGNVNLYDCVAQSPMSYRRGTIIGFREASDAVSFKLMIA